MKKELLLFLLLVLACFSANAQWKLAPRLSLDYSAVTVYDSSANGKLVFNPDILLANRVSKNLSFGVGTGFRRVNTYDFGHMSALPLYADLTLGDELCLDLNIGYLLPINSSSTPILGGFYTRISVALKTSFDDGDEVALGAHIDLYNIFNSDKVPAYIPDGYGPIVTGLDIGLYLQYFFSL